VRVPGRVAAQLRADGCRVHGGHHRVVHCRPGVCARESGLAGVPWPHRRRRILQTQVKGPAAGGPPIGGRRRGTLDRRQIRGGRCHLPAPPPSGRLPAATGAGPAPGPPANVRPVGVGVVRHGNGGRLGRARAQQPLCSRSVGRVPSGRRPRVHRHEPPGIVGHARGRRHADGRRRHRHLQPRPPSVPQPAWFAAVELHPVVGPDRVLHVQQRRHGAPLARRALCRRRARGLSVRVHRRLRRHQVLSVRARRRRLVGVRSFRGRVCTEHRLRRPDVFRTGVLQTAAKHRSNQTIVGRTGCLTIYYIHIYILL